jgi:uncharacterized membrane-anchored protein
MVFIIQIVAFVLVVYSAFSLVYAFKAIKQNTTAKGLMLTRILIYVLALEVSIIALLVTSLARFASVINVILGVVSAFIGFYVGRKSNGH